MELLYSYVLSILYRFVYSGMMVATMFIDMERKMHLMSLSMVFSFLLDRSNPALRSDFVMPGGYENPSESNDRLS